MNRRATIIFGLMIFGAISCQRGDGLGGSQLVSLFNDKKTIPYSLLPSELVDWVQDVNNGLKQEKTIGEISFSLQYKPYSYIISMEERSDSISASIVGSKTKELEGMEYYDFKIKLNNGSGEVLKYNLSSVEEYAKRVEYFSFQMNKDLWLVEGSDSIPCSLFHFERGYDAAPYSTFLLGFAHNKKPKTDNEISFVFQDRIFQKGIIKFSLNRSKLENIPKLKTL